MKCPIPGMESVVATVSGYHGTDRFSLIKLISHSGASFVGAMSRSVTHLVCWRFEGRKYSLAKKFNTVIVNHRWVEECVKQGKRVPEHPYIMQSGEELGPLLVQLPVVGNPKSPEKSYEVLSDRSNSRHGYKRRIRDVECGSSGPAAWTDSLLDENLFPALGKGRRRKYKAKPGQCETSSSMSEKRKVSWHEGSSPESSVLRVKRKASVDVGSSSFGEPSRKTCLLVKKNVGIHSLETVLLDSDTDQNPTILHNKQGKEAASFGRSHTERNIHIFESGGTSNAALEINGVSSGEPFDEVEEIRDWNALSAFEHSSFCPENACPSLRRSDDEDLSFKTKGILQLGPRSPTSVDLSCAICLTEFSSTRGILPCGHRFCYHCIQGWADHRVSMRKLSTCPLCKASFDRIIRVEAADTSDQKIYSQTIPCTSSTDVFLLEDQGTQRFDAELLLAPVCSECRCQEPVELLISCHLCQSRCIHSYCLDPPVSPWTCIHCKDLQRLYHHAP